MSISEMNQRTAEFGNLEKCLFPIKLCLIHDCDTAFPEQRDRFLWNIWLKQHFCLSLTYDDESIVFSNYLCSSLKKYCFSESYAGLWQASWTMALETAQIAQTEYVWNNPRNNPRRNSRPDI